MSYILKTLTTGEKLVVLKRQHWFFWIKPILWSVILTGGPLFYFMSMDHPTSLKDIFKSTLFLLGFIVLPIFLVYFIQYRSKEYAVTNKRVIVKSGVIRIDTDELRNERLENIQIKQSVLGWLFNYGNLEFKGTGGTEVVFHFISDLLNTKKNIEVALFTHPVSVAWRPQKG